MICFRYNQDIKILHFIGETKPWTQSFNPESRSVESPTGYSHLQGFLQLWWDLFCDTVHPSLTKDMVSDISGIKKKNTNWPEIRDTKMMTVTLTGDKKTQIKTKNNS